MRPERIRIVVPLTLFVLAAVPRLWGIQDPPKPYWDEQHYVYDANAYLGGGFGLDIGTPPAVRIASEGTWVHPPLGKWCIALLGIGPFGMTPLGWRVPSVLFGVAGVMVLYLLALELWGSILWAGLAGGFLALDGLHIVQSRLGTLDIFLTTFLTAGFLLLVMDRTRKGPPSIDRVPGKARRLFGSWSRFWAGVLFGAAIATKWAGIFGLAFAIALTLAWTWMPGTPSGRTRRLVAIATPLLLVPAAVYLIAYAAFFYQHGAALGDFLTLQLRMWQYHQHHVQVQPENSSPWTWPLLLHPIRYWALDRGASVQRVFALGNPALWWGALLLVPPAAVRIIRRPTWTDAVVYGGYIAMFAPWLLVGRTQFIYYLLPAVPFLCLSVVATLRTIPARWVRPAVGVAVSSVVLTAVAFLPVWIALWTPRSWVDHLHLLPGWPP